MLRTGAWAVPVIASAVAVPRVQASQEVPTTLSVRADVVSGFPALTVESAVPGGALPAGVYVFTTTGGATADPATFRTEPALDAATETTVGGSAASVVLPDGHTVAAFSGYIVTSALPTDVGRSAMLTVTAPTGESATVPLFGLGQAPPARHVFGPTGGHWPARTPQPDDVFDAVIEADPTWTAIADAIKDGSARYPDGKVKIAVRPGALPAGKGSGSTKAGVLENVGVDGRPWRVLVTPRDGWGTVTGSGALTTAEGYAFVGIAGVALMGFDFTGQEVLVRNARDAAVGWSTFGRLNITANRSEVNDVELVECVLPEALADDTDRMAFRAAEGYSISHIAMRGCYVGPTYKEAGSGAHCDTLQTSADNNESSRLSGLILEDSVFFQSSSHVLQFERISGVTLDGIALIGGLRGTGRYPLGADRHRNALEKALSGEADAVALRRSSIFGSISSDWKFAAVSDTIVSNSSSAAPPAGATFVDTWSDPSTPLPEEWLEQNCPMPSPSRLASLWASLATGA